MIQQAKSVETLMVRAPEAAKMIGVSLRTLMRLVKSNEIPYRRIGERNLRFSVQALRQWAMDQEV